MKNAKIFTILVVALGLMVCPAKVNKAAPMGTAFTYQGRLIDANSAADGEYDFEFKLFNSPADGNQVGSTIDMNDLDVIDGYFTVELDFGSDVFDGNARWLEIGVRPGDSTGSFTTLVPRQEVTPVPYALRAGGMAGGPVLHLHLDEGSGLIAYDDSGNDNHCDLHPSGWTNWVDGKFCGAIETHATDYVQCPSSISFDNSLTFSAWVKPDQDNRGIISKCLDTAETGAAWHGAFLFMRNDDKFAFIIGDGSTSTAVADPNTFSTGQWYLVAGTYDGSRMALYVNGEKVDDKAWSDYADPSTRPLRIAFWSQNWSGGGFNGYIDEVIVYRRALSSDEIVELAGQEDTLSRFLGSLSVAGNVGIGTATPAEKLEVVGTVHSTVGGFKFPDGTTQTSAVSGDGHSLDAADGSPADVVYVDNDGNVDVIGDTKVRGDVSLTAGTGGGELTLRTLSHNDPGGYRIRFDNNVVAPFLGDDTEDQQFCFYTELSTNRTYDAHIKVFGKATNTWSNMIDITHDGTDGKISTDRGDIQINPDGNIRIGVDPPLPRSNLEVAGTIHSKSGGFKFPDGTTQTTATGPWITSDSNMYSGVSGNIGIGTTAPQAKLHVKGDGLFKGNHIACFENTRNDEADGIAIKLRNTSKPNTNRDNNFVTFYNGDDDVVGRIEGFDLLNGDWWTPPPAPSVDFDIDFDAGEFPDCDLVDGSLPSLNPKYLTIDVPGVGSWKVMKGVTWDTGAFPSLDCTTGTLPSAALDINPGTAEEWFDWICWGLDNNLQNLVTLDPVAIAAQAYAVAATKACRDGGVTYGSKGADYAEWLPKLDPNEQFNFGQIVGVHGGKISKKTKGAEQIMAISLAPVVLGNLPPENEKENYEKVGFMGRLPVVVRGKVKTGDYIIPSGFEDGTGIAILPDDLKLEHLDKVLGRAWSESQNDIFGFVDVAIGVKTNEWAKIFEKQQRLIQEQAQEYAALKAENAQLKAEFQDFNTKVSQMVASLEKLEDFVAAQLEMNNDKTRPVVVKEMHNAGD